MWPGRVSNLGPLFYESGALPTALRVLPYVYLQWGWVTSSTNKLVEKYSVCNQYEEERRTPPSRNGKFTIPSKISHLFYHKSYT